MPAGLAQWHGEIGAFYNNTLAFSKISTFYLLLSLPYGSIFCGLDLIKLLFLIISLILNGIMFFYFKKCRNNNLKIGVYLFTTIYLLIISNLLEYLWVASRIISLSGDIEINPGPKANALNRCFSICHWNLNSISAHMFTKVSLLSAYISVHKFDIICLSETYLNSEIPSDDGNLEIPGYNLVREDHPSNSKRGGVCVYYKNSLPFRVINVKYLQESISFELRIGGKYCRFSCLYRSPSQTQDDLEAFLKNFELTLDKIHENNPFMTIVLGDVNAKSNNWCKSDITSLEGSKVDTIANSYGLNQLIQEPTHILNSSSSCIDLIFTSQPNLVMESGIHSSLHSNCHHQIVFAKFNLSIFYPPPYERTVWYYERANTELIRRAIDQFDWVRALSNVNVDEKVYFFTKTLLNIIQNFIPHETITCDDRDPPWINKEIKKLMLEKNLAFKSYCYSNKSMFFFEKFKAFQYQLNMSIEELKEKYYTKLSSRLADLLTSPKTYWSILKTFLNNKKIPCIPPLFHENKFITDFKEKAELFNHFFVNQCSLLSNNSVLPTNLPQLTSKCLDSIHFSSRDIVKIISRLDPNKAHSHDMLSIRMIKLCGNSICKPLLIIFKDCLSEGKFPSNVVPVHKKGNKQSLENYRSISLLPICSKIFERLIYNEMFTFFIENNLISPNQSGFRPGVSCVNQLLAITHEIHKSFDEGFEVEGFS